MGLTPPPLWTKFKKTALFSHDGFPNADDADNDGEDCDDDENVLRAELADRDQQQQEACSRCSYNTRTLGITIVMVIMMINDHYNQGSHDHYDHHYKITFFMKMM